MAAGKPHRFIDTLFDGPLDVVGDVHGEHQALEALLATLGYDADGIHPQGRRLVFVGDLTDRGPDSAAVALAVARLVQSGRAQCVAGNHELNLLRGQHKEGNGWFYDTDHDHARGKFLRSARAQEHHRTPIADFFDALPLALEREDLRVVHACWHAPSIDLLRIAPDPGVVEAYARYSQDIHDELRASGALQRRDAELAQYGGLLHQADAHMPWLEGLAQVDLAKQLRNPVRVVTSGIEQPTAEPFYTGGKWRMLERVLWWDHYHEPLPVIFGHYWRWPTPVDRARYDKAGPDVFAGTHFTEWLGPQRNAFCVDFSVGRRYVERDRGLPPGASTRLGALRWPERELVFEDGARHATA